MSLHLSKFKQLLGTDTKEGINNKGNTKEGTGG